MRYIKASDLATALGVSPRTVRYWCKTRPNLAFKKKGVYYIKLNEIAACDGFDLITANMIKSHRWMKLVEVARLLEITRQTAWWMCRNGHFTGLRIGRTWYLNVHDLGQVVRKSDSDDQ